MSKFYVIYEIMSIANDLCTKTPTTKTNTKTAKIQDKTQEYNKDKKAPHPKMRSQPPCS